MKLIINGYDYTRFVVVGSNSLNERRVPIATWTDGNGRNHKSGILKKVSGTVDIFLRTKESVRKFKELQENGIDEGGCVTVTATIINTGQEKTFDAFIEAELVEDLYNERLSIAPFTLTIEEA